MKYFDHHVVDVDGHIFESQEMFDYFGKQYLDKSYREDLLAMMASSTDPKTGYVNTPKLWTHRATQSERERPSIRAQALGGVEPGLDTRERGEGRKTGTRAAVNGLDPKLRLLDMDEEGIDVAVIFPSMMIGFCDVDDQGLEQAMYRAYNNFMADFCSKDSSRLKFVAMFSMRDIQNGVNEIARMARDNNVVGIYTQTHMGGNQLDSSYFHPLWREAEAQGLAVTVHHGSASLPPWGLGVHQMGGNWFQQHASVFLYEQMRAVATVLGGGLLDSFPKLPFAFLESGCGWLPFWLERLDHYYEIMPQYVPSLKELPSEAFAQGLCFISFDPDEKMLADTVQVLGDEHLVYASDYPHFDCKFPDTVRLISENAGLTKLNKSRMLYNNGLKLYPRLN